MFKRIGTLILLVCLAFSVVPTYAAKTDGLLDDLDYIDDVYKYDMNLFEKEELVDAEAVAKRSRAVMAVLALGIMEKNSDGKFLPDANVPLGEFASIVLKLLSGSGPVTKEWYDNYDVSEFTTQSMAAKYIVSALGYSLHEGKYNTAYPEMSVATKLKLFRNIEQSPEAYITRMELAQLIYNSLSVDLFVQTTFGNSGEYEVQKGATLLSEKFKAIEISGTLTGVSGINLYSNAVVEDERILIDRAEYELKNGEDYSEFLGKRVFAYARQSEFSDLYEIIGLMEHEQDESVTIPLDKVLSASKDTILYENEGRKRISVSNVETVLYNGTPMKNFTFSNELLDYEGSILLGKSENSSTYDIAVIYAMDSFPVLRVTSLDKKVYFKYNLKFEDSVYIDLDEKDGKKVVIIKNGSPSKVEDIKSQDVISIAKSAKGNYIRVLVSSDRLTGTILSTSNDGCLDFDNGDSFYVAKSYQDAYDKAIEEGKPTELEPLKLGVTGSFYLSANGRIADCIVADIPQYAFLKEMDIVGRNPSVRLFDINQEWKDYELADKLVLDGVSTKKKEAYETMLEYEDIILMQPIRYQLSSENKINFLDTMVDTTKEQTDSERLFLSEVYEGHAIDWTLGFNLRPTNYSLTNSTVMFYLPTDRTKEEAYKIIRKYDLVKNDRPKLSLYSPTDFWTIPVALFEGAVSTSWNGAAIFAVNSVKHTINEDDDYVVVVEGMVRQASNSGGFWKEEEFELTEEALENTPTLSKGDVFLYIKNAEGAFNNIWMLIEDAEVPDTDIYMNPGADPEVSTGVITGIDLVQKLIKVDVNIGSSAEPEIVTRVYETGEICIYDSEQELYFAANRQDLNIGDRVLVSGLVRKVNAVVFR